MTTITDTTTGLTREQLKVLRNADDIVVRYHSENYPGNDSDATWFDCIRRNDPNDGYGLRELRVDVPVQPAFIRVYTERSATDGMVANDTRPISYCLWHLYPRWNDNPAHTLVHHILRVGDRVTPVWICNNSSDVVREAGLTRDEFLVQIDRGPLDEPRKCKRLTVMLDTATMRPGSSARNIVWL